MSVEEIVSFLKTWEPPDEWMGPAPEGAGRELTGVVAADPDRFALEARRFQGLPPTYVRALVNGLREAVDGERPFSWAPVLDLCLWVTEQPVEREERHPGGDRDPGWGWTRKAIADLLERGFQQGRAGIRYQLREQAWAVLEPLSKDPEPTPEYERKYGGSKTDPATLSINTTRGEAMHAVVQYALWVRRHFETLADKAERIPRGFDEMPEVRRVLEAHLEPASDPSLAVRSVYGRWFPWLALLDPGWAARELPRIFPRESALAELRDAAWDTYIVYCRPFDDAFLLLREEYGLAIERLGSSKGKTKGPADPEDRVAEHLMVYYWRGKIELDGPELERFYAKAPEDVRHHAMWFVGSVFHNDREVPAEIVELARALWERRITAAREVGGSRKELEPFGWWFASKKFDDNWAIGQLIEVLKLIGKVEPDHLVMERLVELRDRMPREAVQCVRLMIEGAKENWKIYGWQDQLRTILGNALRSADAAVQEAARPVVNVLAARGHLEFGDLLARN